MRDTAWKVPTQCWMIQPNGSHINPARMPTVNGSDVGSRRKNGIAMAKTSQAITTDRMKSASNGLPGRRLPSRSSPVNFATTRPSEKIIPVPMKSAQAANGMGRSAPAIPMAVQASAPAIGIARNGLCAKYARCSSRVMRSAWVMR